MPSMLAIFYLASSTLAKAIIYLAPSILVIIIYVAPSIIASWSVHVFVAAQGLVKMAPKHRTAGQYLTTCTIQHICAGLECGDTNLYKVVDNEIKLG